MSIRDKGVLARRPILKSDNFDNGDEILLEANASSVYYQGYAIYFKKHVIAKDVKAVKLVLGI